MPRNKPTAFIGKIGKLDMRPVKTIEFYAESLLHNKFLVAKYPTLGCTGRGIKKMAIEADMEHKLWLDAQAEMLKKCRQSDAVNKLRLDSFNKYVHQLRHQLIEKNAIFKELEDWQSLGRAVIEKEKRLHTELKNEIETKKVNINVLTEFKKKLQATFEEFEPYETVLNAAVNEYDIWTSIDDCTDRCDALLMAQVDMMNLTSQKLDEIKKLRLDMIRLAEEAALTLLGLTNKLTALERDYHVACSAAQHWERTMTRIKRVVSENDFQWNRVFEEVQSMYYKLCKRNGKTPDLKRDDLDKMLSFIRDEINILKGIHKECIQTSPSSNLHTKH